MKWNERVEKIENKNNGYLINGWDGKHYKTGDDLPMGIYIYEVSYQEVPPASWKHQDRGHLFIIR